MVKLKPLKFQKTAIEEMIEKFVNLWSDANRKMPMLLKSPTGSGKTYMVSKFINELNSLPNWSQDKAFIWITFSDDIAMQSKDKFNLYFENNSENSTLTVNDLNRGKLYKNDILFLNWQKIVSRAAENRKIRRPDDVLMHKETGFYFEDIIDNTHNDNREIILIVDEAHKNTNTRLSQESVDYINPKITIHVTATPDEKLELETRRGNGFVEVNREDVVDAGLIKEKIYIQTEEDLLKHSGLDTDEVLLSLGIEKRNELHQKFKSLGKNINPLMLIQLPNDDKKLIEMGQKTKENVVLEFLRKKGIKYEEIAVWFDGRQNNMDYITDNDSPVKYMLFKQAAGTGWDCPRAHVLVMFREISSASFYVQTVGRILRMPEVNKGSEYEGYSELMTGYLFTNYKRNEVSIPDQSSKNKPYTIIAKKRFTDNLELTSDYIPRVDYGDLGSSAKFQQSFINSINTYFDIKSNDILGESIKKLEKRGINTSPHVINQMLVDASIEDFDNISYEFKSKGHEVSYEMSKYDVEKTFNYLCYKILQEQTDEDSKVTNIARSWGPLKSAIRIWLNSIFANNSDYIYRIFINDVMKANSVFKPAITFALKEYKPILDSEKENKENNYLTYQFTIKEQYFFKEDYEVRDTSLSILDKYCCPKEYSGKLNEDDFIKYLESKGSSIIWWFKNGDYGKDYFSIKYFNTTLMKDRLFYPDWIIKLKDGRIGILDTKQGITLNTEGREEALTKKLENLGSEYFGGIVAKRNGVWCLRTKKINEHYSWSILDDIIK